MPDITDLIRAEHARIGLLIDSLDSALAEPITGDAGPEPGMVWCRY